MDIFAIRHRNLQLLIEQLAARGSRKNMDVAQALGGLGSSYLSQLKAGKKIGDATARKIEAHMLRPSGWMDQAQWDQATGVAEDTSEYVTQATPTLDVQEWALIKNYRATDLRGKRMIDAVAAVAVMSTPANK